jgi:diguanylate cyclase (GGDEF)-like protein
MTPDNRSIRPKGLTQRLAILFGLLALLLLGVAAAYIDFSWHAVKRERLADLRNLVELGAASSEMFLQRYSERASVLAEDVSLHGAASDRAVVRARLLRYQAADPNLAGIYAFLPDGTLIAGTTDESAPAPAHVADAVFRQDFGQALAGDQPVIGRVRYGARVQDWILPVRVRVLDRQGRVSLVLSLVVPLARHQAIWRGLSLPQRWAIGLLRDDGYLQSRFPPPPDARQAFLERHTGALLDKLEREGFPASGSVEGPGTFFSQDKVIVAYKRLDQFPITVYMRMPASEVWTAWLRHMHVPALLFGVSLLATVVAGLWAVRQQHARESERDAAELSLRASAAALRRQSVLLEQSQRAAQIGAWELDVASNELYWTAQTYRIHEVTPEDYTPGWESSLGFFASDSAPFIREAMRRALAHGESWDLELQLITFKNRRIWVRSTGASEIVLGRASKVWGSFQDITQRRKSEEQIIRLAHYDELTNLANRNLFNSHLSHAMNRAARNDGSLGVLFIDLDRFKTINDALGHDVGDEVLQIVARRLSEGLRASDILARLGGDEFVVIAEDVVERDALAALAGKLLSAVDEPVIVRGQEFVLTASIGVSIFPRDGTDAQTLIKNADIAMYRAKELGRNCMEFYSEQMGSTNVDRLAFETQLKKAAAERNQFVLHYQPRISLRDGRVTGVEALVRWMSPERGLVPPGQFIPLAEELGLINAIGNWVLRAAANQATQWRQAGLGAIRVAVNISAQQFYAAGFLDELQAALQEAGLEPGALELEITESVMMKPIQHLAELLNAVRALGVHLSVDDFGTHYSSLAYLKRLPIHYLKIDRSFVHDIPVDQDDVTIVRAVIQLAHNLGMQVVAEGVENEAQLEFLRAEGCDEIQGYLVSRPVPAEQLAELLAARMAMPAVVTA